MKPKKSNNSPLTFGYSYQRDDRYGKVINFLQPVTIPIEILESIVKKVKKEELKPKTLYVGLILSIPTPFTKKKKNVPISHISKPQSHSKERMNKNNDRTNTNSRKR